MWEQEHVSKVGVELFEGIGSGVKLGKAVGADAVANNLRSEF